MFICTFLSAAHTKRTSYYEQRSDMFYLLFIRKLTHELSFSARLCVISDLRSSVRAYDLFWIYESQT